MTIISIEGIDGAGKTTIAASLTKKLQAAGYKTTHLALPTPHGRREAARYKPGIAQAYAYAADMADAWENTALPADKAGHVVLLDRGPTSTVVYQGRHIGDLPGYIGDLQADDIAWGAVHQQPPHLTLLIDVPVALASANQVRRGKIEQGDEELADLRHRYHELVAWTSRQFEVIDVTEDMAVGDVVSEAWRVVTDFLTKHPA